MRVLSRKEAVKLGLRRYFTGSQCKNGHIAPRIVSNYCCSVCWQAANNRWRRSPDGSRKVRQCYESRRQCRPEVGLYYAARHRAKQHCLPFSISKEDIAGVWPKDGLCPVTRLPLRQNWDKAVGGASPDSPTLDRIVPEMGYVPGNIAVISMRANRIKNGETDPKIIRMVADWLSKQLKKRERVSRGGR